MKATLFGVVLSVALSVVSIALSVGCSKHTYSPEVVTAFMNACTTKGTPKLCSCVLDKIQHKYSADQYAEIEVRLQLGGSMPDAMVSMLVECKRGAE
jgi:hypothetical protein